MTDQVMVVTPSVKGGFGDMSAHTNALAGSAANSDNFLLPNDGRTVLWVDAVAGDTFVFTAVDDEYGRTETLAPTIVAGKKDQFGPFAPELWNNSAGQIVMKPNAGNATDKLLWVQVANPT